jgi:hypothetical protein
MDHGPQIEHIRQCVLTTLRDLGIPEADWSLVSGKRLHRDRDYAAGSFRERRIRAVWTASENTIAFYGEDGTLLRQVNVGGELPENQKAA